MAPENSIWMSGLCSVFALALQQKFGGDLWAVVNHSRKHPEPENDLLLHAYCVIDGKAYDAEGEHTIAEASDLSQWSASPEFDDDPVLLWWKVDVEWFDMVHEDFNTNYLSNAYAYIDQHFHLFKEIVDGSPHREAI